MCEAKKRGIDAKVTVYKLVVRMRQRDFGSFVYENYKKEDENNRLS